MRIVKFISVFLLLMLFTMFATANIHQVPVYSLFKGTSLIGYEAQDSASTETVKKPREIPVFLIVYSAFFTGFIFAAFLSAGTAMACRREARLLKRQIKSQEIELNDLRNLSIPNESSNLSIPQLPISPDA